VAHVEPTGLRATSPCRGIALRGLSAGDLLKVYEHEHKSLIDAGDGLCDRGGDRRLAERNDDNTFQSQLLRSCDARLLHQKSTAAILRPYNVVDLKQCLRLKAFDRSSDENEDEDEDEDEDCLAREFRSSVSQEPASIFSSECSVHSVVLLRIAKVVVRYVHMMLRNITLVLLVNSLCSCIVLGT